MEPTDELLRVTYANPNKRANDDPDYVTEVYRAATWDIEMEEGKHGTWSLTAEFNTRDGSSGTLWFNDVQTFKQHPANVNLTA